MITSASLLEILGQRLYELLMQDAAGQDLQIRAYQLFLTCCAERGLQPVTNCTDRLKPDTWFQVWGSDGRPEVLDIRAIVRSALDPEFDREGTGPVEAGSPITPEKRNGPRS